MYNILFSVLYSIDWEVQAKHFKNFKLASPKYVKNKIHWMSYVGKFLVLNL